MKYVLSLFLSSTAVSDREGTCAVVSTSMARSNLDLPVLTAVCGGDKPLLNVPKSHSLCKSDSDVRIRLEIGNLPNS